MRIIRKEDLTEEFFKPVELEMENSVRDIIKDVKDRGDEAVREYTKKFDGLDLEEFELKREKINSLYEKLDSETLDSLKSAAKNIREFAEKQLESFREFETSNEGLKLGQKIVPLDKVGCYVPGGRYPLPSTALMEIIPAKVAGVNEIIVCSPKIEPITIVAADIAGADRIFNLGGVQAVSSLTYGTESIPNVNKIVGPGNKYVASAKKEVYGEVGIDLIAGPSEVLAISDETGNSEFIASDLLAQAEHDPDSKADLVTTSRELAEEVSKKVDEQIKELGTKDVASQSIENSNIILVDSLKEAINIANRRAPEHLEVQVKDSSLAEELKNYGALFIGHNSAEVFGDYCSGPNHTLPTNGAAKYTGGLSVKDFLKILTYQKSESKDKEEFKNLIDTASKLADLEGLEAHKKAANIRNNKKY